MARHRSTLQERLLNRTAAPDAYGCMLWAGSKMPGGYGTIGSAGGIIYVHRAAYEIYIGPIPRGLQIDHICHNDAVQRGECAGGPTCPHRRCVNPVHLQAVTQRANILSGCSPPALAARQVQCPFGHDYCPENTHITEAGARQCKKCWNRSLRDNPEAGRVRPSYA